jgi:glucokinase
MMRYAIGLDIGVTNVKAVGATAAGEILFRESFATQSQSADWPARVKMNLAELEKRHGEAEVIGVAAPGLAAPDGTCIHWMQGRLAEVQGLNWTDFLGQKNTVQVLNDAQAALLGEVWQGAARGAGNAALLTLGTGVGGALLVDGRLLKGHIGRAGHLGHIGLDVKGPRDITNMPGSLEEKIGNYSLQRRSAGRFNSTHDLVAAHLAGDAEATTIWRDSVEALAIAVASNINVTDPEVIIIGGGIATCGDALFGLLDEYLDRYEWRPHGRRARIVPAMLGEYAGAMGAAWNALGKDDDK